MIFTTTNGQKDVEINEASFKDACALKKAVLKSLGSIDINGETVKGVTGESLIALLPKLIAEIDASDEFYNAIFKCLSNCTYDKFYKIDEKLFDDKPEIREDYYEIIAKCAEVNLRPFGKSLVSALKEQLAKLTPIENQEQG